MSKYISFKRGEKLKSREASNLFKEPDNYSFFKGRKEGDFIFNFITMLKLSFGWAKHLQVGFFPRGSISAYFCKESCLP